MPVPGDTLLPLARMARARAAAVRAVFCDIDDTVTSAGRLTAPAYAALESLADAGIAVVPVTGRPAGWCDHIARMWPVRAVVGENGAFYFRYDRAAQAMRQRFALPDDERRRARARLDALGSRILAEVPGAALASDQRYRESDLAIDWCEDVPRLGPEQVARIVECFERAGARAKVSSIHVNGWFGDYDKLGMARLAARECLGLDLDRDAACCLYVGDSPNDAPMFARFENSVGVANVRVFAAQMDVLPRYVTAAACGEGFRELAQFLLAARGPRHES